MGRFAVRILLAALLAFGSEVLAWNNPTGHTLLDWLLILPGYLALSAVLLDFTVRYRARDLFGALVLAGIYSLGAALIIFPQAAFIDMPRTLVTRVMGAHALIAAEMIGLFLALTGGGAGHARRNLLMGCLIVGAAWGFWVKGWPADAGYADVSLVTMLAYGVGGLAIIGLLAYLSSALTADASSPQVLRLSLRGWGVVVIVLSALFLLRLAQGDIDTGALILTGLLLVLSWGILWFRGRTKGETLLDNHLPVRLLPLPALLLAAALFLAVAVFIYNLPAVDVSGVTPVTIIGLGFTGYGLAWLPTVSLVLGARAYLRQIQTQKL
jgi:hypothetical protein